MKSSRGEVEAAVSGEIEIDDEEDAKVPTGREPSSWYYPSGNQLPSG
jgi:hypothetical protein